MASTVYGNRPWSVPPQPTVPVPSSTYERWIEQQALAPTNGGVSDEEIREQGIPALPQVEKFPPRFGYRTNSLGINDMANVDGIYRRIDQSQRRTGIVETTFPNITAQQ